MQLDQDLVVSKFNLREQRLRSRHTRRIRVVFIFIVTTLYDDAVEATCGGDGGGIGMVFGN